MVAPGASPTTFAALLSAQLRRDPGRPLVTFYDDASGERIELSVTTYANWVAKTASLLVEELDVERGSRVLVDLPTHWLGPVFLGAVWSVGACLVTGGDGSEAADLVVCGPEPLESYAAEPTPVLASALLPMGVRFREPLPGGVHDFGLEVWSQPDAFTPWDPPTAEDEAVPGLSQASLLGAGWSGPELAAGDRLLTSANPVTDPQVFLQPLLAGGSLVLVRNADPARADARLAAERVTATYPG